MHKDVEKYLRLKRKLIVLELPVYLAVILKPIKHVEFPNLHFTIGKRHLRKKEKKVLSTKTNC